MKVFLRLFFLIQVFFFLSGKAYPQWIQQTVPSGVMSLETISFSGLHGISGGSGVGVNMIYTTDGGDNWLTASVPNDQYYITAVQLMNESTGYASVTVPGANTEAFLWKTSDGGATWINCNSLPEWVKEIHALYFINENTGFISADSAIYGYLLKTTDGGLTWITKYMNNIAHEYFRNILFGNSALGLVSLTNRTLLKTTDGGESWYLNYTLPPDYFTSDMACKDEQNYFLITRNSQIISSKEFRTTDGGNTWSEMQINSPGSFSQIKYLYGSNTGFLFGSWGEMVKTTDGGDTWSVITSPGADLFSGCIVNENKWYLTRSDGNGEPSIYMTLNGYTPVELAALKSINFSLEQNYPNPFNPTTTIKYSIPSAGNVNIKLYNILGKEVKELLNENKAPGNYTINFDASSLPSGIYFYKMQCSSYTEVKKMILLR